MVNVLGLDIVGSTPVLALRGVRVQYLRLEKAIRRTAIWLLSTVSGVRLVGSEINVTLLNPTTASVHMTVRTQVGEQVPASLAQTIATEIEDRTGCHCEVSVDLMPYQSYSTL